MQNQLGKDSTEPDAHLEVVTPVDGQRRVEAVRLHNEKHFVVLAISPLADLLCRQKKQ